MTETRTQVHIEQTPMPKGKEYNLNLPVITTSDKTVHLVAYANMLQSDHVEVTFTLEMLQDLLFPAPYLPLQIESASVRDGQVVLHLRRDTSEHRKEMSGHTVLAYVWDVFKMTHQAVLKTSEMALTDPSLVGKSHTDWPEEFQNGKAWEHAREKHG